MAYLITNRVELFTADKANKGLEKKCGSLVKKVEDRRIFRNT